MGPMGEKKLLSGSVGNSAHHKEHGRFLGASTYWLAFARNEWGKERKQEWQPGNILSCLKIAAESLGNLKQVLLPSGPPFPSPSL